MTSAAKTNRNAEIVDRLEAEIERLKATARCDWTEEQIDAATRVFCAGLPLETHLEANSLAGMIAKGRCRAPDCDCWEGGRTVTRAALEAATAAPKQPGAT